MKDELLGIVVPVFNTEDGFLLACLDSLAQDVSGYRAVLVDDGSCAHTRRQLQAFVERHEDVFRYLGQENKGQNCARNAGWRSLATRYIMFVDSDDRLTPDALRIIIDALEDMRPDVLAFGFSENSGSSSIQVTDRTGLACTSGETVKTDLLSRQSSLWGLVFKRDLLLEHPLVEGLRIGEDFASVAPLVASARRVVRLDGTLYEYVLRKTSVIQSGSYGHALEIVGAVDHVRKMEVLAPFYREMEWQAIRHLLFWEPLRLFRSGGGSRHDRRRLFAYVDEHYPEWRSNYYLERERRKYGATFLLLVHGYWRPCKVILRLKDLVSSASARQSGR